ncbi:hypothetical protein R1sor_009050 [Riccia sorocarpa]|uniref:Uncharacterized protein n=1 Tax=Riccia sorocarpa TaxID=122646 RepID=A0ABD3H6N2_9MARC
MVWSIRAAQGVAEVVGDNGGAQEGLPLPEVPEQPVEAHQSQAQVGTSQAQAGTSHAQAETSHAQAQPDGLPLTDARKLARAVSQVNGLQAEIAGLRERLGVTEEALRVERRRNFADGSDRSAWESEKTILERRLEICTQERDHGKLGPVE